MVHQPSIRELKAIVESYNQAIEEADRMPDGSPVPDSLEVDIKDTEVWKNRNKPRNDFEPKTNMCPDCEGTGDRLTGSDHLFPGLGYECERCNGEGAVFESTDELTEAASRKDFRMVANLISKIEDPVLRVSSAEDHAKMFALQNPRFDKDKFMAACKAVDLGVDELGEDFATEPEQADVWNAPQGDPFRDESPAQPIQVNALADIPELYMKAGDTLYVEPTNNAGEMYSEENGATISWDFLLHMDQIGKAKLDIGTGQQDPGEMVPFEETADFPAQGSEQECAWWAGCSNDATTTEPHPVLGNVPICDRCVGKLRKIEGLDEDSFSNLYDCPKCGEYVHTEDESCPEEDTVEEDSKPYATMKDGPDKYLFRKDNKQKLVGSADNEPEDGEEELEETDMDKDIREMQIAAGIIEDCDQDDEKNDDGDCSPFTHGDENVDMVREDGENGTWPGPYEESEAWEGQSVKITGGKYAGETGKVIHAEAPHGESGSRQAEFMVNLYSGGVVTLYPGEWADDQLELQYDPNVRPEGKYDPALEEDDLAKALGRPDVPRPDLSDLEYEICPECGVTGGHDDACGELAKLYQEDAVGEDLLLAPKDAPGPEVDSPYKDMASIGAQRDPEADYNADDYYGDDRVEPELDRQTDFNAPPRDDGDDSYDMNEEPNDDERIIDVGDDEDYETYDFDDEFEQMLGGSSDMPGAEYNGMYEMNDLRRLAGLEKVMEEEECDEEETCDEDKEELDEIAPVIAAVARGAGAALADKAVDSLSGDVEEGSAAGAPITDDLVAYNIADEKAYYVMADVLGAELDFGPQDEVLVPLARNDQVLVALDQQGFVKDVDFRVAGEQYEADLQNGYNDRAFSDGQDYFPKGSHQSPADDLGPTASDQGDNPMSNRMRSVEKDDVYESMKLAYRRHRKA